MARIVFETDIAAPATTLVEALATPEGIAGWWTDDVGFDGAGVGAVMRLGFAVAPLPFELTITRADPSIVAWQSTGAFPPHWNDTTMTWTMTEAGGALKIHFNHDGWEADDGAFPSSAYTWGQLLTTLKHHAETGAILPLFRR